MTVKQCPICEGNGYPKWEEEFTSKTTCAECEGTGFIEQRYPNHNEYRVELTVVVPEDWYIPDDVMEYADQIWLRSNDQPAGGDYVLAYIEKQLLKHPEFRIPNISVGKYVFLARSIHLNTNDDKLF